MNEFESDWISLSQSQIGVRVFFSESERRLQGVWIQDGSVWKQHSRIQDGCNHQVESEWMSEVFFLFKMAESKMVDFKMAAIIKLSQNEWVKFILYKMAESKMVEFKMAAIIKLSQNEWVKFFFVQNGWIQDGRDQDGWHRQVR